MKKIISILMVTSVMFLMFSCCAKETPEEEITTTTSPETTCNVTKTTKEETVTTQTETIKIKNEEYSFTFEKTDFEKNYSEETLMKISELVPMEYGFDDYDNWSGTPNEVINDALCCMQSSRSSWFFERYDADSSEHKAAIEEMSENPYVITDDGVFTDIDKINEYLAEKFGPEARQFKAEDFETYDEAKTSDEPIALGYGFPTYRYVYLPKSKMIGCFTEQVTSSEVPASYIYDIQTVDNLYIVKAVSGSDDYGENGDTFAGMQRDALIMFNEYTEGVLENYILTLAADEKGNLYVKSVEKSYILPDDYKNNYKVISDKNVEVKVKKFNSSEWEVVDILKKDDEVYSIGICGLDSLWIVTENYKCMIEEKCLAKIE